MGWTHNCRDFYKACRNLDEFSVSEEQNPMPKLVFELLNSSKNVRGQSHEKEKESVRTSQ